ncbi:MAG: DMT family transporter [Armatimonadota bacterium]
MNHLPPHVTREPAGPVGFGRTDLLLCVCMALWGLNFVAVKLALRGGLPPLALLGLRWPLFGLAMLAIARGLEGDLRLHRRHLWAVVLLGVVLSVNQIAWTHGLHLTLAPKAAILMTTSPVFAALFAPLFRDTRLSALAWVGVFLALSGSAVVITGGSLQQLLRAPATLGDVLIVCAAMLVGAATAGARPLLRHYSPLKYAAYHVALGALFLLPATAGPVATLDFGAVTPMAWLGLSYSIVFAGVIGFWIYYRGVGDIGGARTAIYMAGIPVTALLGAALLLRDEVIGWVHVVGAAITIVGVWMARRY